GPQGGDGQEEEERLGVDGREEECGGEDGEGDERPARDLLGEVHADQFVSHDETAEEGEVGDDPPAGLDREAGDIAQELHQPRIEWEEGGGGAESLAVTPFRHERVPGSVPVTERLDEPVLPAG